MQRCLEFEVNFGIVAASKIEFCGYCTLTIGLDNIHASQCASKFMSQILGFVILQCPYNSVVTTLTTTTKIGDSKVGDSPPQLLNHQIFHGAVGY